MKKIILGIGLGVAFLWALFGGPYPFHPLFEGVGLQILLGLRLPAVIGMMLSGFGLGVSGVVLQGLFRNPLADPALLGFSAGAGFFVIVYMGLMTALNFSFESFNATLPFVAFLGALFSMGVMSLVTRTLGSRSPVTLLLCGIGWSIFLAAMASLIFIQLSNQGLHLMLWWGMGGQFPLDWFLLSLAGGVVTFAFFWVKAQAKALDVMVLGEREAKYLGVNLKDLRIQVLFGVALLVGVSVALTGPIGFVGLMVPHFARMFFGFKHAPLLFISGVLGACVLLFSHAIAVQWFSPRELPLGVVTALFGVPCFFYALLYREVKC